MTDTTTRPATDAETAAVLLALAQRVQVARAAHDKRTVKADLKRIDQLLDQYNARRKA